MKGRELAGEGFRFFDLVRTGKAAQEMMDLLLEKMNYFLFRLKKFSFLVGNWAQNPNY
jgi:hypothetical protein